MATTTNYGWTTPNDTDLVKDGAAAIRTLGSSIDTTTKALNPSTTLGDIEYRSSTANTNTRLPLGTASQVLSVNSGATAPEWVTLPAAGGLTLLSTTTLSGATVTISSISQSYKSLYMVITGVTNATNTSQFRCAPNGTTNIANQISGAGADTWQNDPTSYIGLSSGGGTNGTLRTSADNSWEFTIGNYTSTASFKPFTVMGGYEAPAGVRGYASIGQIATNTAITSLVFSNAGGNLSTGTVLLYGVS